MSKIVAFIGSPRKNGNSTILIEQVIAGAKSVGAEIITFNLNDDGIKGCQGCLYCRENFGCATKDKLQPMYEELNSADGVIVSFPIRFGGIGGQAKQWLDRMYPMLDSAHKPRIPGKNVVTVFAQGNPNKEMFKTAIDTTNIFFNMFGWELVNSLISCGSTDPAYTVPQELLEKAFEAGKQLVKPPQP